MDLSGFITYFEEHDNSPVLVPILKKIKLVKEMENECVFGCENLGMKMFLDSKRQYIEEHLNTFLDKNVSIIFIVSPNRRRKKEKNEPLPLIQYQGKKEDVLNNTGLLPRFTFENFAVSNSNHIAHAAAQAVADRPGTTYNPLFIYGDVGVGKTHLSQAVGNIILDGDMRKRILYCTSEQFTNDLVESIREKNTGRIRKKYRQLDALIVDDVQFIAGKSYVQEEFYHTFNTIVQKGGQIILTSDRPPREIKELEDRLRSRFSGGLIIDMQRPDFELRTAILLIKAQERNINIDMVAAQHVAEKIRDTRELEGALLKLMSISLSQNNTSNTITAETTKKELSRREKEVIDKTPPKEVIRTVASFYGIKPSEIKGSSRKEKIVRARQVIMYLLRKVYSIKYEEIAFIIKRKDHTTIIHGVSRVTQIMGKDNTFRDEIASITEML